MVHQVFDIVFVNGVVPRVQIFQQLFNLRGIKVVECYLLCRALLFPLMKRLLIRNIERTLNLMAPAK